MSEQDRTPVAELGAVAKALLAIARDGVDDRGLAMRICRACVDGLGVDGAAISLLTASVARQTLAATDATADLLEDLQFTLNEGACMQAARTGRPVLVADLQHSSEVARWPMFAAAVIERVSRIASSRAILPGPTKITSAAVTRRRKRATGRGVAVRVGRAGMARVGEER